MNEHQNELQLPELCVRFLSDYGLVPAGIATEIPRQTALSLIHSRRAIPVGDFKVTPDICISEDELEQAGISKWNANDTAQPALPRGLCK